MKLRQRSQNKSPVKWELRFGHGEGTLSDFQPPLNRAQATIDERQFGAGHNYGPKVATQLAHANAIFHFGDGSTWLASFPGNLTNLLPTLRLPPQIADSLADLESFLRGNNGLVILTGKRIGRAGCG